MSLSVSELSIDKRLSDVSASLQPGQVTAICGPNGAGKSTLLESLAGLLQPDTGQVTLDETPLASLPHRTRARRIGYLPQDGQVAWDMAVRNLVALGRLPHGDRAAEPVARAMAALGLDDLADRPVSQLSGGERARTLLARVFAGEPDWILADEPLAALDLAHQLALLTHLRRAADDGAGVVLVVHDLALAMNHADTVIVLDRGKLVAQGKPQDALSTGRIAQVWGVRATWLGERGARALATL